MLFRLCDPSPLWEWICLEASVSSHARLLSMLHLNDTRLLSSGSALWDDEFSLKSSVHQCKFCILILSRHYLCVYFHNHALTHMNIVQSAQSVHFVVRDVWSWRLPDHISTCGSHSNTSNRLWTRRFSNSVFLWSGSHQPGSLSQSWCPLISGFHEPAKGSHAIASGVCQQPSHELSRTCSTRPSSRTSLEFRATRM